MTDSDIPSGQIKPIVMTMEEFLAITEPVPLPKTKESEGDNFNYNLERH